VQYPNAGPRSGFTVAQITALIRDAPSIAVGAGCELIDTGLNVLADITDDFAGGFVGRNSYATLHGTATLGISRRLDWGQAVVRPYMTLSDGTITARFNLGAYYTSVPATSTVESPATFDVTGFDLIHGLNTPVGESFALDTGAVVLTEIQSILTALGFTNVLTDQTAAASVLPAPRVWPIDDDATWLTVVNDLLGSIGYQGIWSDWDGYLRLQAYATPITRLSEWTYDTDPATAMLDPDRTYVRDYFQAPNRWVAVRTNNVDGAAPVEGAGIFTYTNEFVGDTSVQARGGRVITRRLPIEATDQDALVRAAQVSIDADINVKSTMRVSTSPNPLHWHFDRITVDDTAMGPPFEAMDTQWSLPLDGGNQTHEWTAL
jgi:hypothetical protein